MDKKIFFIILLSAVVAISLFMNWFFVCKIVKYVEFQEIYSSKQKIMDFRNLFSEKILLADGTVDFETRLSLETAVRALKDKEIFTQWQVFANAKTSTDATRQAKELLKTLIRKTSNK
jgi:hypothetical protein